MEMALLTPDPHPELSKELYKAIDWGELVNIKENEGVVEWRKTKRRLLKRKE